MRAWSPAAEAKLVALYASTALPRLAFLLKRTEKAIRSRAKVLGITKGTRRPWTRKEDALLRKRYATEQTAGLARELRRSPSTTAQRARKLGLSKARETVAECTRRRWREGRHENSRKAQFPKGHVPANKGLRRPGWHAGRMRDTQFKKGARPHTWKPVGSTRINADGYRDRKVSDTGYPPRDWKGEHILLWEEHLGPVPPSHCICFKNGDKTDIRIDNLACISRRERMRRNSFRTNYPPEIVSLIQTRALLVRTINRRTRREEQSPGPSEPPVRGDRGTQGRGKAPRDCPRESRRRRRRQDHRSRASRG